MLRKQLYRQGLASRNDQNAIRIHQDGWLAYALSMEWQSMQVQSKAGLMYELQVLHDENLSDPSRGGSCGYALYQHEEVLDLIVHQLGLDDVMIV